MKRIAERDELFLAYCMERGRTDMYEFARVRESCSRAKKSRTQKPKVTNTLPTRRSRRQQGLGEKYLEEKEIPAPGILQILSIMQPLPIASIKRLPQAIRSRPMPLIELPMIEPLPTVFYSLNPLPNLANQKSFQQISTESRQETSTESRQETSTESRQETSTESRQETSTESRQETSTESRQETSTESRQETSTESRQEASTEFQQEILAESWQEALIESQQETSTDMQQETSTESRQEIWTQSWQEIWTQSQQEASTESRQEASTESRQEASTESRQEASTESRQETSTESRQETLTESRQETWEESRQETSADSVLAKFACTLCPYKTARDNLDLDRHHKSCHILLDIPLKCGRFWCGELFHDRYSWKEHTRGCTFLCPEVGCNKRMKYEGQVESHKRNHQKRSWRELVLVD